MSATADDLDAFRAGVYDWLAEHATSEGWARERAYAPAADDETRIGRARRCQRMLFDAGFAGLTWPVAYGGQGRSVREQIVFNQEAAEYQLPLDPFVIGLGMCGPTVLTAGTEAQKQRYIRPLLAGTEMWCQLFSEPGAGSDVASLSTRAELSGDRWIVSGQKVWTSGARHAQFGLLLARSDPDRPKHAGLTMFVLDMTSPGVDVRPLRQMSGVARFNEVFLDGVAIAPDRVLGDVHGGWRCAIATLMNERVSIGVGSPNSYGHDVPVLVDLARERAATDDVLVRQELADLWMHERIVRLLGQRITDAVMAGREPGPEGSLAKLAGTRLAKRTTAAAAALLGAGGIAWHDTDARAARLASVLLAAPGLSIAGGTDEILRNVVGERVLGLPKEDSWRR